MQKKGKSTTTRSFFQRLVLTEALHGKSKAHQLAYIAVMTAFCIVANVLESQFPDNQFSLTITAALLTGIIIGAVFGFTACFLGDFIGFIVHPAYLYMPWVGLSTGMFAFISGTIFNGFPSSKKWVVWLKLFMISLLTFVVCTIGINSVGFYYYNKEIGFSTAVLDYVAARFGGEVSFFGYVIYRLIFKGQIWNSVFNYLLIFVIVPMLSKVKVLKIHIH